LFFAEGAEGIGRLSNIRLRLLLLLCWESLLSFPKGLLGPLVLFYFSSQTVVCLSEFLLDTGEKEMEQHKQDCKDDKTDHCRVYYLDSNCGMCFSDVGHDDNIADVAVSGVPYGDKGAAIFPTASGAGLPPKYPLAVL